MGISIAIYNRRFPANKTQPDSLEINAAGIAGPCLTNNCTTPSLLVEFSPTPPKESLFFRLLKLHVEADKILEPKLSRFSSLFAPQKYTDRLSAACINMEDREV